MDFTEHEARALNAAPPLHLKSSRISLWAKKYYRLMIGIGAVGLLLTNISVGLVARGQQQEVSKSALSIYENVLVSTNYIHHAQMAFQHYVDVVNESYGEKDIEVAKSRLSEVIDDLDVAIERASSPRVRERGQEIRELVVKLDQATLESPELPMRFSAIQNAMEQLAQGMSAIGLHAHDDIEAVSDKANMLLLASVLVSLVLVTLVLIMLRRVIGERTLAHMTYMATYDALTGLPNRALLRSQMQNALRGHRTIDGAFAVLSLDLDRFKNVNDTLGHPVGDTLLVEVARRIKETLRTTDMVARLGGDEFVIMQMPSRGAMEAGALADRVVSVVSAPYFINEQRIIIGASIGVALAPTDGEHVEELLRNSDIALYRAKADGKGVYRYFPPEMNAVMQSQRLMELDLREATENNEMKVFFQPLMDIETGQLSACEALVRWIHPTRGAVSPAEFIPLAEENGLIVQIGEHVLRTACREAVTWQNNVKIAVNLSAVQFRSGSLPALVASILDETGLEPSRLELEITESVLIAEKCEVMRTLTELRALGVRIALDDFGTGYSSLSYLTNFPFDKIKIDRTFVCDVMERPDSAAIIRAILTLAGSLNLSTTAEGVEKVEELDWLRAHGCNQAQGFLFSKAVPALDLRMWMGAAGALQAPERPARDRAA